MNENPGRKQNSVLTNFLNEIFVIKKIFSSFSFFLFLERTVRGAVDSFCSHRPWQLCCPGSFAVGQEEEVEDELFHHAAGFGRYY